MLAHPTQERLQALGLTGMAKALDDQRRQPDIAALSFEERFALLLDREAVERGNKRLVARLRFAALRQEAVVEDVDIRAARGLDRALFQKLAAGDWIDRKQNLLVIGPTGLPLTLRGRTRNAGTLRAPSPNPRRAMYVPCVAYRKTADMKARSSVSSA